MKRKNKFWLMSVKLSGDKKLSSWKVYCWINPEGICYCSRETPPVGFVAVTTIDQFKDWQCGVLSCHGFKKQSARMTQEELSRGWLLL